MKVFGMPCALVGPEPVLTAHLRCAGWIVGVHCICYTIRTVYRLKLGGAQNREAIEKSGSQTRDSPVSSSCPSPVLS